MVRLVETPAEMHVDSETDLAALLEASGAVMRGHFILTSGRHSDVYFEKFRILEQPQVLSALCSQIAHRFSDVELDVVAGPTTGGIIIAFEVARQMGIPAVYVETENGKKTLRRGKTLATGTRCLIVDDVLTTGTSLVETQAVVEQAGGTVAAFGVLIDRSSPDLQLMAPLYAAYQVSAKSYDHNEIPEWLAKIPATKPGTRTVIAL